MNVTRSCLPVLLVVVVAFLFTACVDLTRDWRKFAGSGGSGDSGIGGTAGSLAVDADSQRDAAAPGETTGTGGTGGLAATDAAAVGETRGLETGDPGGFVVADAPGETRGSETGDASGAGATDAGNAADAALPQDIGNDVPFSADADRPSDLGTVASDAGATGESDGPHTDGRDGSGADEADGTGDGATESAPAPMIISIDFVGGVPNGAAGASGTVVMEPSEVAGVKRATHWNSAPGATGTLLSLMSASGSTTTASASWNVEAMDGADTWSASFTDAPGDTRMMNGYLDPRASNLHATVTVKDLPDPMSSGYDVYVYFYSFMSLPDTFSHEYQIGSTTYSVTQKGPSASAFPGYQEASGGDGGTAGEGNYVVFRNLSGRDFALTALPKPSAMGTERAPVNGIQIVYPSGY